ncbi:MAG: hypothetical protein OXO51_07690 [Gemmatimonadota bacterium]|nr:hypothetical protein [Gemmatimonadota bacterium]
MQPEESTLQTAEDEATLGELGIHVGLTCLTQAVDSVTNEPRDGANLSAYQLAEWLAWHWWRLRWEPARQRRRDVDWSMAHDLACIGGGWLWPNITIKSDGELIVFDSRPSRVVPTEPLRYTTSGTAIIQATTFEEGIDDFVTSVLTRLEECTCQDTDLHSMWSELSSERQDEEISLYRRFEAYLGFDPDEAEQVLVESLIEKGKAVGLDAMSEVAADDHQGALGLDDAAREFGFDTRPGDGVQSVPELPGDRSQVPAWKVGVGVARQLRGQENLGDDPISNSRLAELCGVSEKVLSKQDSTENIAFAFALDDEDSRKGRVVLRSSGEQGRRFAIARLLADRLLDDHKELLHPATGAYTYRQKTQRAFAGEFLCPVDSLLCFLNDDFSDEKQQDAAEHFNVSSLAVQTLLVNNGHLDREESELQDPEARAA